MNFHVCCALIAMATPPPPGTQPNPKAQLMQMVGMFVIMGFMLYFVMIRPQQKKARDQAALIQSMKAGDRIVTHSGIVGVVVAVKDKTVSIRSADTKLEVLKSAVSEISERSGGGDA